MAAPRARISHALSSGQAARTAQQAVPGQGGLQSGLEEGKDGEYATAAICGLGQAELHKDGAHVRLDGLGRDDEAVADRLIRGGWLTI
jgi:hypothetical protein